VTYIDNVNDLTIYTALFIERTSSGNSIMVQFKRRNVSHLSVPYVNKEQ